MSNKLIDPGSAQAHGIKLDNAGFPTEESMRAYHHRTSPNFFEKPERGFHIPLAVIPLIPVVVFIILFLKN